jgi:hypothetical protein
MLATTVTGRRHLRSTRRLTDDIPSRQRGVDGRGGEPVTCSGPWGAQRCAALTTGSRPTSKESFAGGNPDRQARAKLGQRTAQHRAVLQLAERGQHQRR